MLILFHNFNNTFFHRTVKGGDFDYTYSPCLGETGCDDNAAAVRSNVTIIIHSGVTRLIDCMEDIQSMPGDTYYCFS